jgi:pentatricopeptide repeat protein
VLLSWRMVVQELKIAPDEGLCVSVLHTAARHGLPDLATDVLRVLKLMGAPWKEHHFAPLVEAFCRTGQIKEAILALDIMRSSEIEPRTETASPILGLSKGDTEAVDATWAIIDELHKEGKRIDITAFHVLIKASVALGDLQRAIGAYKSFPEYDVFPDLPTFNLLLQGCVSARHRKLGSLLLEDMQAAKVKPDKETYTQFISLCLTEDTYEDAFFYLEEMKTAGFKPPRSVYEAIVQKCISVGDTRHTIALQEMTESGYDVSDQLARQINWANDNHQRAKEEEDRLPDMGQPVGLDGAARAFIESGGLAGREEMGKTPGTYTQQ